MDLKSGYTFTWIDGTVFNKYKYYRYAIYFILLALWAMQRKTGSPFSATVSVLEELNLTRSIYLGLVVFFVALAIVLHTHATDFKVLGRIMINSNGIELEEEGGVTASYAFVEMYGLKIRRGATYHYDYKKRNYLVRHNNWIEFTHGGEQYAFEFKLESAAQNKLFEEMIAVLKQMAVKFQYLSI